MSSAQLLPFFPSLATPSTPLAPTGRSSRRVRRQRYLHAMEQLEPRQLMSVDLSGTWAAPTGGDAGSSQTQTLHITNNGTTSISKSIAVDVYVVPHGSVADVTTFDPTGLPVTHFAKSLSIGAGATRDLVLSLPLSASLAAGDFDLIAIIDPANKILESDETNNRALSAALTVTQPDIDLNPTFSANSTLPAGILDTKTTKGTVQVVVSNLGTAAITSNTTITIQVVARPVGAIDDSQDIVLNQKPVTLSVLNLASAGTKTLNVPVQFTAGALPDGQFDIIAITDTGGALSESDESNNEALLGTTVTVGGPFFDVTPTITGDTLPASILNTNGSNGVVTVHITNSGNSAVPASQSSTVTLTLHPASGSDFTFTKTISLGGLAANKSKDLTFNVNLPQGIATGDLTLSVDMSAVPGESNSSNNSFTSNQTITVTDTAFSDLALTDVSDTFGLTAAGGSAGNGTVTIENLGTSAQKGTVVIRFFASPTGDVADGVLVGQKALSINLNSGQAANLTVPLTLPFPFTSTSFTLFGQVLPGALADVDSGNNIIEDKSITLTNNFVDLQISSASNPFSSPASSGATASSNVKVQNIGNISGTGSVTITFFATTNGNIDNNAIQIGQATSNNLTLAAGATSGNISVNLTLPSPSIPTDYKIVARVTSSGFGDTFSDNNTFTLPGTLTVI